MIYEYGAERFPRYQEFCEKGVGHAPRGHSGVPRSISLYAPYLKEQEYMVYGWGFERFPRYNTFYEMKGVRF